VYAFVNRAFLPHAVFFVVLAVGWWLGELSSRRVGLFLALYVAAIAASPLVAGGVFWLTAFVALIDVVLILLVVKSDIRIH
jgi:hypothetical protein